MEANQVKSTCDVNLTEDAGTSLKVIGNRSLLLTITKTLRNFNFLMPCSVTHVKYQMDRITHETADSCLTT
jgi:hypothetical protein